MSKPKPKHPPDPWEALTAAILHRTPPLRGGLCIGRAPLFDGDTAEHRDQALDLCRRCPVLEACQSWAETRYGRQIVGVVAGRYRRRRRMT